MIVNEGLRPLDLKEMIDEKFEVDTYKSKMGEDQDVCVISFKVKDRDPARDLMEFIEKGFSFVLDSDVSSGENSEGEYFVFVEIERNSNIAKQINDITESVKKLTGIENWKFVYHKKNSVLEATLESLKEHIPSSSSEYESAVLRIKTESVKKFFNKTLMDDLTIDDSIITIHKPFDQKIKLKLIDESPTMLEGAPAVDEASTAEIFWLTKVLGDYNISKFGDQFLFSNKDRQILLQRID
jgi:hypothetical protein